MKIPSFSDTEITDNKGRLTDQWRSILSVLISQLQTNVSDEGFKIPFQTASNINILNTQKSSGAILYNSSTNKFVGNIYDSGSQTYTFRSFSTANENGLIIVDDSLKLGGELPSYYLTASNINIEDIGGYYPTNNVEDALQYIPTQLYWDRNTTGTPYLLPKNTGDEIGATSARVVKGWFTNLEVTNPYSLNGVTQQNIATSSSPTFKAATLSSSDPFLHIINTDGDEYGSWKVGINNVTNFTIDCIKIDASTQIALAFQKKLADGSIDFGYMSANLGIGTTSFGSSATKTLSMGLGVVPSTSPDNCFQMYASEFSEGNTVPTFRTGAGVVVKLNQDISTISYPVLAGLTLTGLSGVLKATAGVISGSASKSDIGLGNVDNTSDASKPISSATQTALNAKQDSLGFTAENVANKSTSISLGTSDTLYPTQNAVKAYVDALVGQLFNIQGDWNANTNTPDITGETHVGYAWRVSVAGNTNLGGYTNWNVGDIAIKTSTGWMQIINSDISAVWGNISGTLSNQTDLSNALGGKEPTITAGTSSQYWRGDKSWQTLDKTSVGLSNVDNTSDASKPISSATQTALNAKQDSITGGASSIVTSNLSANKILISTAAGKVDASAVTTTTLGYLDATSSIQSQLNGKQATITGAATTITGDNLTANRVAVSNASGKVAISTVTTTTLGYLDATSSIQTQLNGKQASGNYITALTGDVTASGPGSVAATIANGAVSLAKMANLAANSIIGNNTAGATTPLALTGTQVKAMLSLVKGDVGLGSVDNVQQMPLSYLDTDNTLAANSDSKVTSQKAVKYYIDNSGHGGTAVWGGITGTLSSQTDLNTALGGKEPTITAGTTAQYWRGDKSWQTLNSTAVGLGNVTNDAQVKKIASATDNAIVRWDSTTGAVVQNSTVTIDDNAVIAGSLTKIAFNNPITNNQISLWGGSTPTDVFYGFGIASGILRYQVDTANSAHVFYYATGASSSTEIGRLYSQGFSLNSATIGTNGTGVVSLKTGVAPSTSPADCVQYYSADFAAGNACPTFRTENGTIVQLNQAIATTSSPSFRAVTLSGTDPLLNIVNTDGDEYGSWDIGINNVVNFVIDCVKIDTTKQIALAFQKKLSDGSIDFGYTSANFGIGTTSFGTNAAKVLSMGTATAPATSPANCFQMYSDLYNAGTNVPTFRLESGTVVQLAQNLTPLSAVTFNGITSNDDVNLAVNKVYKINGTQIGFANLGDQLAVNGLCYGDPATYKLNSNYAIYFVPASYSLNAGWGDNADGTQLIINNTGYQSGNTKFRNFAVGDGKGNIRLLYVGQTNTFTGYGDWGTSGRMTSANLTVTAFSTAGILANNSSGVISSTLTPTVTSITVSGLNTAGMVTNNASGVLSTIALTPTINAVGFSLAGGTSSKTLTISGNSEINQNLTTASIATFASIHTTGDPNEYYVGAKLKGNVYLTPYDDSVSGGFAYITSVTGGSSTSCGLYLRTYSASLGFVENIRCNYDGAVKIHGLSYGTVYTNGGYLTNTDPSYSPWKNNIETLPSILDKVLQIRPVSYIWKPEMIGADGETNYGFLSDEVVNIIPELVGESTATLINEDGSTRQERGLGLYKDRFLPFIVKSIQEMYDAMPWWVDAPETSSSPGEREEMAFDSDYLYICVGDNDWRRLPLEKW